jgi:hypothetical protein
MARPKVLVAFTKDEADAVQELLALAVLKMMGRKMEEGDWRDIYCKAKQIPVTGWSNLNIDVMHGPLGVEHKMLCRRSDKDIRETCGTSPMHPSLTRSIRVPPASTDPNDAMARILTQYGDLVEERRQKVIQAGALKGNPDMRTGWLLWQTSLRQFLYFEEEMLKPDPSDYRAEWVKGRTSQGGRKSSTNLWIYEKATGAKRYSVTSEAGAKIQPYFDVPPLGDPNLFVWTVIGEVVRAGVVRVWLSENTASALRELIGSLDDIDAISAAVIEAVKKAPELVADIVMPDEKPVEVLIKQEAYDALCAAFRGVNDNHQFQLLADLIRSEK